MPNEELAMGCKRRWMQATGGAMAGLLIISAFLIVYSVPAAVASDNLDDSWALALTYFLVHKMPLGVAWIITYGPLGGISAGAYYPGCYWASVIVQSIVAGSLVLALWRLPERSASAVWRLLFLYFAVVAIAIPVFMTADVKYDVAVTAIAAAGALNRFSRPWEVLLTSIALAFLASGKFTYLIESFLFVVIWEAARVRFQRARYPFPLAVYLITYLAAWELTGNHVGSLTRYFALSWEVASGYNAVLSLDGPTKQTLLALAFFVTFLIGLAAPIAKRSRGLFPALLIGMLTLVLAFKHGFVRQDIHAEHFFAIAMFVAVMCATVASGAGKMPTRIGVATVLCICICYLSFQSFGYYPRSPLRFACAVGSRVFHSAMTSAAAIARGSREPDVLDKQYTVLANRYAQPMFAKIVGGHSIDFYSYRVGLPILCGLNYRPRPAVQSYFGCTPALDVLDGNYYFGKGGPDFVLAELEPVDGKLPAMEDRDALLALLSCYKPVAERDGILLYRKYRSVLPGSVAPGVSDTASVVAQMDQWCQAPDLRFPYVAARMSVKPTLLELVGRAVFRPRILYIDVQDESGHVSTHRLGGQNVSRGLLMRPLIGDTSDLLAVGTGHMDRSIQKFRIHYRTMFGNKYTIRNYLSDISITFVGAQSPLDLVGKCRRMSREP